MSNVDHNKTFRAGSDTALHYVLTRGTMFIWSSRLLHYAKSRPNGKLIYNSIMNGPYVRRMIPEPGDPAHTVPVPETFHEQTDDELTEAEIKQMEDDDHAIQTILLGLPEDIYVVVDSMKLLKKSGMNLGQDNQMQMVGGNGGNQFRQYAGQNVGNQVVQNAVQNPGVQNVGNQNGVIVVSGIANQNGNGNVVAVRAEGNANGNNGNEIRCYNCRGLGHLARNCTVRPSRRDAAYLQTQLMIAQKEEAGIQTAVEEFGLLAAAADLDGVFSVEQGGGTVEQHPVTVEETRAYQESSLLISSQICSRLANEADESLAKHKALELEIERLLRAVVSQDIMSIVQNNSVVDTSNLQTELERTKEHFENCIIKKENEYAKLWNDRYKKCKECKYDKISYDKAYNDMQQTIKRLQAQLGDQKGKYKDTPCVSNTLDPLPQKLENENVELEFQIRNYEKENAHLKAIYKNLFDFINVTRAQTKTIIDSLQTKLRDTIYQNAKLRAQLFDKVSDQKDPSNGVDITIKTRRPQSRSNTKNDKVPSASKSSRIMNKEVNVEDHLRNLLLSKNKHELS
ncbi:retrovirus-related pol polyprotein from transposon TNT 1-94 [Tanacetum coccineum]